MGGPTDDRETATDQQTTGRQMSGPTNDGETFDAVGSVSGLDKGVGWVWDGYGLDKGVG